MPGVVNIPPPIFLDKSGALMNMENPVIEAPQGEIVQGVAMDIAEEGGGKGKDKADQDEEPQISAAVK